MQRISKTQLAFIAILFMLCAAMTGQLQAVAATQGAAPQMETATAAQGILAQLDRAKIQTIRNATDRADLLAEYDALKAVAGNTSQARETILLAKLHRATLKLKGNGQQQASIGSVDECGHKYGSGCPLGSKMCQVNMDGCIAMIRFHAYFPSGGPDGE